MQQKMYQEHTELSTIMYAMTELGKIHTGKISGSFLEKTEDFCDFLHFILSTVGNLMVARNLSNT